MLAACLLFAVVWRASGTELQGVIIDPNCAQDILKHGRHVVKKRHECSLMKDYAREGYGMITDDRRFFRFDDAGNKRARELLKNTSDRDNLKVIVSGEIDGSIIKVANISLL